MLPTSDGLDPIHRAALDGEWSGIHAALAAGVPVDHPAGAPSHDKVLSHEGATALHLAAMEGQAELCARLIGRGASVDTRNARDETPLHYAAWSACDPSTVGTLLGEGADPNAVDWQGLTPLHLAARSDRIESVILLLRRGAQPGVVARNGMTPLHQAAINGRAMVARRLLDAGCDAAVADELGMTAADWAQRGGHDGVLGVL